MSHQFSLNPNFVSLYEGRQPEWGGVLGYVVYKRTYARPLPDGSKEEWLDTCKRVVEGCFQIQQWHCNTHSTPWNEEQAQRSAQEMFQRMWEFKWLPPGRGLWMMGTEFMWAKGGAALNNCGFVSTKNLDLDFAGPFCWLMEMSMLGVGVGFDTFGGGCGIKIEKPEYIKGKARNVYIEDTREGWVSALRDTLEAFVGGGELPVFHYDRIRPAGEPIKGFGGTASGPNPLIMLLADARQLLTDYEGREVDSALIVDLMNMVGRCVVSGNVRRSAEIALGADTDEAFMNLKDPKLFPFENTGHRSWRWAANHSVIADEYTDFHNVWNGRSSGREPLGFFFLSNAQDYGRMGAVRNYADAFATGTNPCAEQTLEHKELCCLVETFPAHHGDELDYFRTLKYAYLYAKTVTLMKTHDKDTNAVIIKNRRIGTSMSGIQQAIEKFGFQKFLYTFACEGYENIKEWDSVYSDWFGVAKSVKVTSVKPSGTISLLCGATPGIHFPHSQYYIRNVRFSNDDPLLPVLRQAMYKIEPDVADQSASVVSFPVEQKHYSRSKQQVPMWEQLEQAAQLQAWWADNQVSITVTYSPEEAEQVPRALEMYSSRLKSVSFLPLEDHGFEQAPYIEIDEEEYGVYRSSILPLAHLDSVAHVDQRGCDGDACTL